MKLTIEFSLNRDFPRMPKGKLPDFDECVMVRSNDTPRKGWLNHKLGGAVGSWTITEDSK